jgi:hypothetical protein
VYTGWGGASGSEASSATLPTVDGGSCFVGTTEPCPKSIPTTFTGSWAIWQGLGINPAKRQLQCGYIVNFGKAGDTISATIGSGLLGTAAQSAPWWYAIAMCDNDGKSSTTNATFATASTTMAVSAQNEHQ